MYNKKNIIFGCIYTVLFSLLIFIGQGIFFPSTVIEEGYIEPTVTETYIDLVASEKEKYIDLSWDVFKDENTAVQDLLYETYKDRYTQLQKDKVTLRYIPSQLENKVQYSYSPLVESFVYHGSILPHIDDMDVLLYKSIGDTRGRMKLKKIHMYGVLERTDEEFLSVLIHEFAHYFDIYSFDKTPFGDTSQKFYDISWQSVTTIKPGLDVSDFVSGYSMTNWYEDFAESYTYYIFHNEDFLVKAQNSKILAQKYIFMKDYVFQDDMFLREDFSLDAEIKSYYWDITKIPFDVKKFLQYMKDAI